MTRGTNGSGSRRRRPPVPVAVRPRRRRVGPAEDAAPSSAFLVLRRAPGRRALATASAPGSPSPSAFGLVRALRPRGDGFPSTAASVSVAVSVESPTSPEAAGLFPRPRPPRRLRRFAGEAVVPSASDTVAEPVVSDAATSEVSGSTDAAVAASDARAAFEPPAAFPPAPRPRPRPPRLRRREAVVFASAPDAGAPLSEAAPTSAASGPAEVAAAESGVDVAAAPLEPPSVLAAPPPPRPRPPRLRRRLGLGEAVGSSETASSAGTVCLSSFTIAPFALARGAEAAAGTEGSSDRTSAEALRALTAGAESASSFCMRGEPAGVSAAVPSRASSRTRNALVLAAASPIAAQPGGSPGAGVTGAAPSPSRSSEPELRAPRPAGKP